MLLAFFWGISVIIQKEVEEREEGREGGREGGRREGGERGKEGRKGRDEVDKERGKGRH